MARGKVAMAAALNEIEDVRQVEDLLRNITA
jgi:hypothetical protein